MPKTRLLPLAALIGLAFNCQAHAEEAAAPDAADSAQLKTVTVTGKRTAPVATDRIGRSTIDTEMIRDTRDLVRYSTDIGIVDSGRHLKGFSMRGVEGNRVGISVDGVSLPDSEQNTLYERYGNFNSSRLSIDPELVRGIDITKGSSSFESGSGSMGGSVNYRTYEAADFVRGERNFGGLLKTGYSTRNNEWTHTAGIGYVGESVDAVLLYTHRYGHQNESRGSGPEYSGGKSQHPDPAEHRNHGYLAKIGFRIDPAHRIGFSVNGQTDKNFTDERSYQTLWNLRHADDRLRRINTNAFYEYTPESSSWLSRLKLDFDYQRSIVAAVNYKYSFSAPPTLDEISERNMKTWFARTNLRMDFQPFSAWGQHNLSLKAYASRRDFANINYETLGIGRPWSSGRRPETIQYPIRTIQLGMSLKDRIVWNDTFSGLIGVRYDYEKLKPRELNAPCSRACTAEGRPAGNSFSIWNGTLGLNAKLSEAWRASYTFDTGHRTPTASEMYFSFKNPYGTWKSNPGLKPERSFTHNLNLEGSGSKGTFDLNLFHSRYRDFLFESETITQTPNPWWPGCSWYGCREFDQTPNQQMRNVDRAKISGIDLKGRLNLDTVLPVPEGLKLMGGLGYSKGSMSNGLSMLSIQPFKAMIGLDYEQPEGRWGIFSRLTYFGRKKPQDAQVMTTDDYYDPLSGGYVWYQKQTAYNYLNDKAWVFDLYGFYNPTKSLTLRAGIYNLTNRKYHTWDALRGINAHSTTNTVDRYGKGLERFYAPGRNYAVSLEYRF